MDRRDGEATRDGNSAWGIPNCVIESRMRDAGTAR